MIGPAKTKTAASRGGFFITLSLREAQ